MALPQYAGTRQKVVEAVVLIGARGVPKIEASGTVYSFDANGCLDVSASAEAVTFLVSGTRPQKLQDNVIDLGPVVRHRRWERDNTWLPPGDVIRKVIADIRGTASTKIPTLKPEAK